MNNKTNEELIFLGECRRVHGIKGEFVFKLSNDQDSCLQQGSSITLIDTSKEVTAQYLIESIKFGNKVIVKLDGISDRDLAESMLPFEIFVDRESFVGLDSSEFYLNDLIGHKVINVETQDFVGIIDRYYSNGAYEIAVIKGNEGVEIDIPMIKPFICSISFQDKTIEMKMLEETDGQ